MEANTLYYTFSAIPQVIGAIAAIIASFTHFRIATLRDYLIGDGKSVINRWGEVGYYLPDPIEDQKQKKRLRDSIDRRNIPKIKRVIFLLCENEIKDGYSRENRPTGLQYVYDRFCATENDISRLRQWTSYVILFSFTSIIVSIISLAMTDNIMAATYCSLKYIVLWVNVLLFITSLITSFYVVHLGLIWKTAHEADMVSKDAG